VVRGGNWLTFLVCAAQIGACGVVNAFLAVTAEFAKAGYADFAAVGSSGGLSDWNERSDQIR
jgi:hypothetical protein